MREWENIFSFKSVLGELCRLRLRLATKRQHDLLEACRASEARTIEPVANLFPPRIDWHRFRPKTRRTVSPDRIALQTLLRTVKVMRREQPDAIWVQALEKTIHRIQQRALLDLAFSFDEPQVLPVPKEPDRLVCRPICKFSLEDAVIGSLTSRYLRRVLDPLFHASSLAFREGSPGQPIFSRDAGVKRLLQFRQEHMNHSLFVAEIDLKSFYDCVDHELAKTLLRKLVSQVGLHLKGPTVAPRALTVVEAYLNCYSFPYKQAITNENPQGRYAWPIQSLAQLHTDPLAVRIGIPQGGGLSNLLANVLLHEVDKCMAQLLPDATSACYLRYCDDLLIVCTHEQHCCSAQRMALTILKEQLHLPVHPPVAVEKYNAAYWQTKSREPYQWTKPQLAADVPWIQFLGYQIRYDGLLRISKKSVARQRDRIRSESDRVLKYSSSSSRAGTTYLRRIMNRLINLSVGKKGTRQGWPVRCWADGFQLLHHNVSFLAPLKSLDRYREKNLRRILRLGQTRGWALPYLKKRRGFPYSYVARFTTSKKFHHKTPT